MGNQTEPGDSGHRRFLIIGAFIVLAAALAVCIVLLVSRQGNDRQGDDRQEEKPDNTSAALERGFVDQKSADDIMAEMFDKVAEGMFECKMTTTWTFENTDAESPNAYVANAEGNRNTIYFDVYDNTTKELLYSSPMLPVGSELTGIRLDKKLQAGEYDAVVMYTLVDEEYQEVSTVGFNITITVNQ